MQFTIESRNLTQRESARSESRSTVIDAVDRAAALSEFVRRNSSELMSIETPGRGGESIATVRKDDAVYLIRVYQA